MRCTARALTLLVAALVLTLPVGAARTWPDGAWERIASPQSLGWSHAALQKAEAYARTINTAAVSIVTDGRVLHEWGDPARRYNIHSIRKSFLSALYGVHVAEGTIDLSKTLEELGIDDNEPSLTDVERTATVHMLLKARSGVYHPALYETAGMAAARPKRGSHAPDTFWYYNNWDFNALGTIFERETKTNLFREFQARIAEPIGMEDFRLEDTQYVTGRDSVYPAYPFRMSTRDLARFGLLFLREGEWNGRQVVPRAWVAESTRSYSDAGASGGYGYLWWIAVDGRHLPGVALPDGSYSARGAGGHYILVVPAPDLVIVHRVDTDVRGRSVSSREFGELVRLILAARTTSSDLP